MRLSHFESLKPICPLCKIERQENSPLTIASIEVQHDNIIIEGYLHCPNDYCQQEYPIIDGVPIIFAYIHKYLNDNFYHITVRDDLSSSVESILGDAAGPGAAFNNIRHYLSSYAWDHFSDKAATNKIGPPQQSLPPGSITDCLQAALQLLSTPPRPAMIDIGCALGRSTFELAERHNGLALGIDINFSLLRTAQHILRHGVIRYPLKRIGIVYDRHQYNVSFKNMEHVDFWACDALALPFKNNSFNFVSALNVFDTVTSPLALLKTMRNILTSGGNALLATPYDWSPPVPVSNWVGGHSQRGTGSGASEPLLRKMLLNDEQTQDKGKFEILGEIENHRWNVRVHNRRTACYDTHIIACRKQ